MDHDIFTEFTAKYYQDIYVMIRSRSRSEQDAEDIFQETLLKIYKGMKQFRGDARKKTWLYRIVTNTITDYYRKPWYRFLPGKTEDCRFSEPAGHNAVAAGTGNPQAGMESRETSRRVLDEANRLPPTEREIFLLRFFDDFSLAEIAEAMNANLNTVKTHLYRAIGKVRKNLVGKNITKG